MIGKRKKHVVIAVLCAVLFMLASCTGQKRQTDERTRLVLMPRPSEVTVESGILRIEPAFELMWAGYEEPRLHRAVDRFFRQMKTAIGDGGFALKIQCEGPGEEIQSIAENESYTLSVSSSGVVVKAPSPVGIIRGLATLFQLIREDDEGSYLPAVQIQDEPRFPWRGLLIDVCRHWIPMEVIKRNLDGMAAVKLNVLHWHLSEDQGFRVESKVYPKLHEMGSDGFYYTQDQVQEILAYARDRGIRVVPEFDMPGHTTSWFVGYPELSSSPGPFEIGRTWGVQEPCMDPTKEETYAFLDIFIEEMAALFPDAYFHIGGDEVNGISWDNNPRVSAFKKRNGMKDNHDLQAYFNKRILAIVQKHDKKMIGWDEIFHPDLPKDVVVHSWRGPDSLAQTASAGYMGILSNGYYLDHILTAEQHYRVDPHSGDAAQLTAEEKERILGGEACMWGEFVVPETIDSRIWPRTAAIAERFWSPQSVGDVEDMYRRLEALNPRLDAFGLKHRSHCLPMLQRLAGDHPIDALKTLADIVEPVKYYSRPRTKAYTQMTPLDRFVDAARPESHQGRKFAKMVERFLDGSRRSKQERKKILDRLVLWRDNHKALNPVLEGSPRLKEIIPLSEDVAALAEAGIRALDYIEEGREAPLSWVDNTSSLLSRAPLPDYEVIIKIVPAIQSLVYAARPPLVIEDFEDREAQGWMPNMPENWSIVPESGSMRYQLREPGTQGEVRAPTSWAVLRDYDLTDFVFTGRLKCNASIENPHRDMVIIFGYQDPTHFYYVHFSASSDENHNIIGLVNGTDRVKINLEPPGESIARLTDKEFHAFKITFTAETGDIKAYLDDMKMPILTAKDTTFSRGRVGLGSFDDTGSFDDIKLWGNKE